MDTWLSALDILLRLEVLVALLIGSVGGVIIGAIPGVGPPVAIAILLPATFAFDPIVGLTALLGIYGSSMYGGAIPAILINTPGTPVNALTSYNGYPMTQQGQAARALGLAYGASFLAGVFSIVVLMLMAPVVARIAPLFGSREIFLACVLGIVLVILAHRGQVLAAGMMAFLGIFLATVGMEPIRFTRRFAFDQSWLAQGIDLIAVVLGLFAISQALVLLIEPDRRPRAGRVSGSLWAGMAEVFRHKRVAGVSAATGTTMGILPGVGEFTSQFLSYTYAEKTSKTPELFGKGAPEGLIASEASNNSVPAAAMIPLLALGIPGEELTAMMLSVFYVHNVVPGPGLFQNHMDFVLALYMALLILNVMVILFLLVSTNWIMKMVEIPTRFLGAAILILSFIGAYSMRNSLLDVAVTAGFGVVGFVLRRLDLPIVPIVLGMVLGGIMETRLRTAMVRVDGPLDFVNRPVAAILFGLILLVIALHLRTLWRGWRKR